MNDVILEVINLVREFPAQGSSRNVVRAVDDVSFTVYQGEALGLVGESGSGKSTTARCILRLIEPTSGAVLYQGRDVLKMSRPDLKVFRRDAQLVFQDPYSSLDPKMRVGDIISEGLQIHFPRMSKDEVFAELKNLLSLVGLREDHLNRFPESFSGGERQRIGIARALAVRPSLLVCDEPVASLDVSIQAQVLNLFQELKESLGLTIIFIAHDLATVRHLCQRVAVMEQGVIREIGSREQIYQNPQHPYTRSLMAAVPEPDPKSEREKLRLRQAGLDGEAI
jgi:ABC-type oligopeptide transport system ATPase subunit